MNQWKYGYIRNNSVFLETVKNQKYHLQNLSNIRSQFSKTANMNQFRSLRRETPKSACSRVLTENSINQENSKIFSRLLMVKPTINSRKITRENQNHKKYRMNLQKSKYKSPDFTLEAQKMSRGKHIQLKRFINMQLRSTTYNKSILNIKTASQNSKFKLIR